MGEGREGGNGKERIKERRKDNFDFQWALHWYINNENEPTRTQCVLRHQGKNKLVTIAKLKTEHWSIKDMERNGGRNRMRLDTRDRNVLETDTHG
jgi:hypothetical protein